MPPRRPIRGACGCSSPRSGFPCRWSPSDLAKGEQHGEAYRAINPRRLVADPRARGRHGDRRGAGDLALPRGSLSRTPLLGSTPKEKALVTMVGAGAPSSRASPP